MVRFKTCQASMIASWRVRLRAVGDSPKTWQGSPSSWLVAPQILLRGLRSRWMGATRSWRLKVAAVCRKGGSMDYAIGDIHGCLDKVLRLLEVLRYDPAADRLIFLGDYIDR